MPHVYKELILTSPHFQGEIWKLHNVKVLRPGILEYEYASLSCANSNTTCFYLGDSASVIPSEVNAFLHQEPTQVTLVSPQMTITYNT